MAAIAQSLLGVAAQLGLLISDPASAAVHSAQDRLCDRPTSLCKLDAQRPQGWGKRPESGSAGRKTVGLEDLRQGLLSSSLRQASLNRAASQNLQARFAFHTLRYAIATNNYFRVRHANEDCTEQVAAWNNVLNAAKMANINSYIRDLPPDCPLR